MTRLLCPNTRLPYILENTVTHYTLPAPKLCPPIGQKLKYDYWGRGFIMKTKRCILITLSAILIFSVSSEAYQLTFTPRMTLSEEYSDNIFLLNANGEEEYIALISPGFTAGILGKSSGVEISYDFGYSFYQKHEEFNSDRHNAFINAWIQLSKNYRIDIRNRFFRTEDPIPERNDLLLLTEIPRYQIDNTIRKTREPFFRNFSSIRLNHQFGELDNIYIEYINSILENEDPAIEDNSRQGGAAGLIYWFLPWGVDINATYTKGEYDVSEDYDRWGGDFRLIRRFNSRLDGYVGYRRTEIKYTGQRGDDNNYQVSIGTDYLPSEDFSINLNAGYFGSDSNIREDFFHTTGNISYSQILKRSAIKFIIFSGTEYADFGAENLGYSVYYGSTGSASYQMRRNATANVFLSYRNTEYKDVTPSRDDRYTVAGASLDILTFKILSLRIEYTFRKMDSTINENDYEVNRIFARLTIAPSNPFRVK